MPATILRKAVAPASAPFADEAARWSAVLARDTAADGAFVFAVSSTGIYCRPSCPARRPKRAHVGFFSTPAEAEAAGFRACLRCRPQDGGTHRHAPLIAAACRAIAAAETPPSLAALATGAGLSPAYFQRLFKAATGLSPKAYADATRAARLRDALVKDGSTMTDALYDSGFSGPGRFYAAATDALGMAPAAFRDGGRGMEIQFACGPSPLGLVLVARSDKGVCAILMGDDAGELAQELARRFPKARRIAADAALAGLLAEVAALLGAPHRPFDLPLDLQGTLFQQQVWHALRGIPAGETVSYAELARRVGRPDAVRAVASACGANPVAVVVPCHRVLRGDGSISGYRWGVERKRRLLAAEAKAKDTA